MHAERQLPLYLKLTEYAIKTHYFPGSHLIHTLYVSEQQWMESKGHEGKKNSEDMWRNLNQIGKNLVKAICLWSFIFDAWKIFLLLDAFLEFDPLGLAESYNFQKANFCKSL